MKPIQERPKKLQIILSSLSSFPLAIQADFKNALSFFKACPKQIQTAWILLSIVCGSILTLVLPIQVSYLLQKHELKIVATGNKNPSSNASEVWLFNFVDDQGNLISLKSFDFNTGWEIRDGTLLSNQDQPASISWKGFLIGPAKIFLLSHPWSGIAEISWDNSVQIIDLYSKDDKVYELSLPVKGQKNPTLFRIIIISLIGCLPGFVLLVTTIWMASKSPSDKPLKPIPERVWLLYAGIMFVVWGCYLLIFWPGMASSDSTGQILQSLDGYYSDLHPVLHTFLIGLLFRISNSVATIALAQIILLALTAGYGLMRLQKAGIPQFVIWSACAFFALSPVNSTMVISIWKDVPFSITILWLTIFLFEILLTKGEWLNSLRSTLLFFFILLLISFFRHNGQIVSLGVLVIAGLVLTRQRRRLLFILSVYILVISVIRGPVFSLLGVQRTGSYFSSLYELFHIAAHMKAGTAFTDSEIELLNKIRPVENAWGYECYSIGIIITDPGFQYSIAFESSKEIQKLFLDTLLRNPFVNLKHMICSSSIVWEIKNQIFPFNAFFLFKNEQGDWDTIAPEPNPYGWKMKSIMPFLVNRMAKILVRTLAQDVVWFIWRPAIYLYLIIFGAVRLGLKFRNILPFLMILPVLLVSLSLVLVNGSQDFRYAYPIYLTFCFMWPYLFWGNQQKRVLPPNRTS